MKRHDHRRPTSALTRLTLALGVIALAACSSSDKSASVASDLSDEERLKVFWDNAWRYMEMGEVERATAQAERGLEIDPDNSRFMLVYGRGRLMRGTRDDVIEAISVFENIPQKDDWRVQSTWGAALERLGIFHDEAAAEVATGERATEAKDPIARAAELRDDAFAFWREARVHFVRSTKLRSGETEPMVGLVRVNALLGDDDESIRWGHKLIDALESSLSLNAEDLKAPGISANREESLFRAQRSTLDQEVKTRLHIATLERNANRLDKALEQLELVTAIRPREGVYHSLQAKVLFEMGRFERARESVDTYLELKAADASTDYKTDPDVKRAFELREDCIEQLARSKPRGS